MGAFNGRCLDEGYLLQELGMEKLLRQEYGLEIGKIRANDRIFKVKAKNGVYGL